MSCRTRPQPAGLSYAGGVPRTLPRRRVWAGTVTALILPPLLTWLLLADPYTSELPLDIPIFLLVTVVVALIGGMVPAVVAAVISSLLLNWFFVEPVGTLTVANPENTIALVVFVLVGVLVALIVHRNAARRAEAQEAQRESAALVELSHSLLGATDQIPLLLQRAVDMFGVQAAAIIHRPAIGVPEVVASVGAFDPIATADHEDADTTHELALQPAGLAADQRRLFDAFAAHAGAILQRHELQRSATSASRLVRDNEARTALLSAVSHDLRTPLAGIKAAIGSLRSSEMRWSKEDEDELKAAIEESVDRLELLVANLLDMSRLQTGALVAHPTVTDLGEVIPATLKTLSEPEGQPGGSTRTLGPHWPTQDCSTGCSATSPRMPSVTSRTTARSPCTPAAWPTGSRLGSSTPDRGCRWRNTNGSSSRSSVMATPRGATGSASGSP